MVESINAKIQKIAWCEKREAVSCFVIGRCSHEEDGYEDVSLDLSLFTCLRLRDTRFALVD